MPLAAPTDDPDERKWERLHELSDWFAEHQQHYPQGELPRAAELRAMAERMSALNSLYHRVDATFHAIQQRCGQLRAAVNLLTALCTLMENEEEGRTAFDTLFAGKSTFTADLQRYENIVRFSSPISGIEASTPFLTWYRRQRRK